MGWGEPRGPEQLTFPSSIVGTTSQIETARIMLHSVGVVGNNLAEEAFQAADLIRQSQQGGG